MLPEASTYAAQVDSTFMFIVKVSLLFLVMITAAMVYFAIRYNRKYYKTPKDIEGSVILEITWTVIPTILVMFMFWYGYVAYRDMRDVPADAIVIKGTASKWAWNFTYANGKKSQKLYVPVNRAVKVELESKDVLHSLFIPAFRVKEDAVPGRSSYVSFTATETREFDIECAEYCGLSHSAMLSKVVVMPQADFETWLVTEDVVAQGPQKGLDLLKRNSCTVCHAIAPGGPAVGPSLQGVFGRTETVVTAGQERQVVVDEAYIRQSLLDPGSDVVKGFPNAMPSQKGILTDDDITAIIDYLKELK